MSKQESCRNCSSTKIIPQVDVFDQGEYSSGRLTVGLATKPHAVLLKGLVTATVTANVCGECGYLELFISDPQKLYDAYVQRGENLAKIREDLTDK